jgi:putative ABC transport system substrate-binding protein
MTRLAVALLAFVLLAVPLAGGAQPGRRVARIGYLSGAVGPTSPEFSHLQQAFLEALRELGHVEGENLVIERRYSEGRDERLPELAAELVRLKVDVIVATGGSPPYAAKRATSTIPVVFTNNGDPVGSGLVASLARPGGNVTGPSLTSPALLGKRVQLLKEAVPRVSRLAILSNPTSPMHALSMREAEAVARSVHVQLQTVEAGGPGEIAGAFSAVLKGSAEGLVVLGHPLFAAERQRIAEFAARNRLPVMAPQREYADAGTLLAYGASLRDSYRRAATYVDKILKGAKPADLPVEQPTKFELVVNLKTAKVLGLTIPQSVLLRADEVIQ